MPRILTLALAFFVMVQARIAIASDGAPGRPLQSDYSAASADLDGDNQPDLAIGKRSGLLEYTVEIRFSSRIPSAFLRVANASAGISVIVCDVNRDNFPDVVVQAATSVIPVAIWLGDGKGHFREGVPWQYLPLRMDPPPRIVTDADGHSYESILTETRFDPAVKPAENSTTDLVLEDPASSATLAPQSRAFDWRDPGRSPPALT